METIPAGTELLVFMWFGDGTEEGRAVWEDILEDEDPTRREAGLKMGIRIHADVAVFPDLTCGPCIDYTSCKRRIVVHGEPDVTYFDRGDVLDPPVHLPNCFFGFARLNEPLGVSFSCDPCAVGVE